MAVFGSMIRISNSGLGLIRSSSSGFALCYQPNYSKYTRPTKIITQGSFTGNRLLYSAASLGVEKYEENRQQVSIQFQDLQDKFRHKMHEILQSETQKMIFTEDLKNAIHLAKSDDIPMVIDMAKKFNSQNSGLRFGVYLFGPVFMRMFHYLNQSESMLKALNSQELEGFFDQITSYQLAMDLLYKQGMYQELLNLFDGLQEKRLGGIKYPKNCLTLAVAACYKMNTPESYKKMIEIFEGSQEYGSQLNGRIISFASALALNQGYPHISFEILSRATNLRKKPIMNLKILTLIELGRVDDVFPILRAMLRTDLPDTSLNSGNQQVFRNIIKKIEHAVEEKEDKLLSAEWKHIEKGLEGNKYISEQTFDEYICSPIDYIPPQKASKTQNNRDRQMLAASFNRYSRTPREGFRNNRRPGLMDME